MGLTTRRKTAKYLVDSRKKWKILTFSRKKDAFLFPDNISYVFLFLRNFKIRFPSVFFCLPCFVLERKTEKNLTFNLNRAIYTRKNKTRLK